MTSLASKARIAGLLYIVASLIGVLRLLYIPKALFVHGNAAATANNIATHESLFRLGMVSYLIAGVVWLFVPLALYRLLKDVGPTLAAIMVILGSFLQTPTYMFNTVTDAAALLFARRTEFATTFGEPQREAFVMLSLGLHHHLDLANFIFAGLWLFPFGLLVYKSRFLPRFLGVWLMAACFAWLAFSFTGLLLPERESQVFAAIQVFALGEVATMLWLLIAGARYRSAPATRLEAAAPGN